MATGAPPPNALVGGWSDYSAIEPHLAEPTEARIGDAMRGETVSCDTDRLRRCVRRLAYV